MSTTPTNAVRFEDWKAKAVQQFDANVDGVIDAADPVFNELRVWQDAGGDAANTLWAVAA